MLESSFGGPAGLTKSLGIFQKYSFFVLKLACFDLKSYYFSKMRKNNYLKGKYIK